MMAARIASKPPVSKRPAPKPRRASVKARRTAARLAAVQCLYQMELIGRPAAEAVQEFIEFRSGHEVDGATFVPADVTLLTAIVRGAEAEKDEIASLIDEAIRPPLERDRLELLLKATLAAGIWELRRHVDLAAPIVIAEYVSIASAFYGGPEPGLVNGILDRVARKLRPYEFATAQPQGIEGAG